MLQWRDDRLATSGFVSTAELAAAGSADVAALAPVIRRTGDASTGASIRYYLHCPGSVREQS